MRRLLRILTLCAIPFAAQAQGVMPDEPVALPVSCFHVEHRTAFASTDLKDHWAVVMIEFLTCPNVFPFTLGNLEAAIEETGMRMLSDNVPKVWFLSVDPDRDGAFASENEPFFHPDFRSITSARDQIHTFVRAKDGFYRLMPPNYVGYHEVQHSSAASFIVPDGTLCAKLQRPLVGVSAINTELLPEEVPVAIAWFAEQNLPAPSNPAGRELTDAKNSLSCHNGSADDDVQHLTAQHARYLVKQTRDLRDGRRTHSDLADTHRNSLTDMTRVLI